MSRKFPPSHLQGEFVCISNATLDINWKLVTERLKLVLTMWCHLNRFLNLPDKPHSDFTIDLHVCLTGMVWKCFCDTEHQEYFWYLCSCQTVLYAPSNPAWQSNTIICVEYFADKRSAEVNAIFPCQGNFISSWHVFIKLAHFKPMLQFKTKTGTILLSAKLAEVLYLYVKHIYITVLSECKITNNCQVSWN